MQYALLNGIRREPYKTGLRAICEGCDGEMISKCGSFRPQHWAHKALMVCDSWWEPETVWHREWKNHFPENCREITFYDPYQSEKHRADIHLFSGDTIEFQNSALSFSEMQSRETFYKKLIWVVNGCKFKGFKLGSSIPDPNSPLLDKFLMTGDLEVTYTVKEERLYPLRLRERYVGIDDKAMRNIRRTTIHYSYAWKNKHKVWIESTVPVYIDLGNDFLYQIKIREQAYDKFEYLERIRKKDFIEGLLRSQ